MTHTTQPARFRLHQRSTHIELQHGAATRARLGTQSDYVVFYGHKLGLQQSNELSERSLLPVERSYQLTPLKMQSIITWLMLNSQGTAAM
jgi:hypothetical protein